MQTILLNGDQYETPDAMHGAIARMLNLPAYYGRNADALHDCLEERAEPVSLWIGSAGEGETAVALSRVARVIGDCGGQVVHLER